jgi:hypothetical protein
MYVVKVLGGHPKDIYRQFKHYITFCVQQHALGNTCGFHVCLTHGCIWSATELRGKCKCIYFTLSSMFMIKYAYSSFANTYFSFYCGRTMKTISLT